MADRRQSAGRRREDSLHWCAFDWGKYDRDTDFLTVIQHGAYVQLMSAYYRRQAPLPAAVEQLYRIAGAQTQEERDAVDSVLQFFYRDGEVYRHDYIDRELECSRKRIEAKRLAGQVGGKASAQARVKQLLSTPPTDAQHSNSNSNKKESKPSASGEAGAKKAPKEPNDERHFPIREYIKACQRHAKVPEFWDGRCAKELDKWLAGVGHSLAVDTAKAYIVNRFRSKEPRGDPPWMWIPKLGSYAEGPHNEFKRVEGSNGNGLGKADQRLKSNLESLHRISLGAAPLGGGDDGGGTLPLASGGDTRANATVLDADVGVKSAGSGK